jgi:hypothetical protein
LVLAGMDVVSVEDGLERARKTGRIDIDRGDKWGRLLSGWLCLDRLQDRVERRSHQGKRRYPLGQRPDFSCHRSPCGAASERTPLPEPACDSYCLAEFSSNESGCEGLVKNFTCDRLTKITLMFP